MKDTDIRVWDTSSPACAKACACEHADPGRRLALRAFAGAALAAGTGLPTLKAGEEGPHVGDLLVQVDDEAKTPLTGADVKAGAKPVIAYPMEPGSKELRDGTRLNRILLIRGDPAAMDAATAPRAAEGVLAYSAFCTHQGCDVNSWVAAEKVLLCFCHFSKFDPLTGATVMGGPAPRPLPALPLKIQDGKLAIAGSFTAPPGKAA